MMNVSAPNPENARIADDDMTINLSVSIYEDV